MGLGKLLDTTAAFKQAGNDLPGAAPSSSSSNVTSEQRPLLDGQGTERHGSYGTAGRRGSGSLPKVVEDVGDGEEEEEGALEMEMDDEEYLEEKGFYVGSYKILLWQYTLVPLSSLSLLVLLSFLPSIIYHTPHPSTSSLPSTFPFPLPELILSSSVWSLSHIISTPLYTLLSSLLSSLPPHPSSTTFSPLILVSFLTRPSALTFLNTSLLVFLRTLLRLAPLAILGLRHEMDYVLPTPKDAVFWRVWMGAVGWSLMEVGVGVWQGWEWIGCYKDVLVPKERVGEIVAKLRREDGLPVGNGNGNGYDTETITNVTAGKARSSVTDSPVDMASSVLGSTERDRLLGVDVVRPGAGGRRMSEAELELEVEKDLDELAALKTREELEELYGYPVIRIPVFVSVLLRLASILLSLGFTLLLSSTYLSSPISLSPDSSTPSPLATLRFQTQTQAQALNSPTTPQPPPHLPHPRTSLYTTNTTFYLFFLLVFVTHLCLALLHTHLVLPSVGVHVVAYVGFLVGIGAVFAGLGMWGGVV